eukprot:TRINITY_DN9052_c0_g1_i1.p1 TRINITY_DN9052_c0_g1~~TRINITY_DN9052_c0_g1_i1.p1  ORF type:complete len:498 (-),score=169.99 TRINITY_DN9052_c0_g1_i1:197-1615(-)
MGIAPFVEPRSRSGTLISGIAKSIGFYREPTTVADSSDPVLAEVRALLGDHPMNEITTGAVDEYRKLLSANKALRKNLSSLEASAQKKRAKGLKEMKLHVELVEGEGGGESKTPDWLEVYEVLAAPGGSQASIHYVSVQGLGCVMKELSLSGCDTLDQVEAEVRILESLPSHPNIVRYLFHHRTGSHLRLFMTKYDCTLSDVIKRRTDPAYGGHPENWFEVDELLNLFTGIVKGVQFLHSHCIIHRDLKTENIFMLRVLSESNRDQVLRCAIGDFDTAKSLARNSAARTVIGTPSYMAPEIITARATKCPYSFSADVFSLGMVLYEMITLHVPYSGDAPFVVSEKIINGVRPELPEAINNSDEFAAVVRMMYFCTSMIPQCRPSPEQLLEMIEMLAGDQLLAAQLGDAGEDDEFVYADGKAAPHAGSLAPDGGATGGLSGRCSSDEHVGRTGANVADLRRVHRSRSDDFSGQ